MGTVAYFSSNVAVPDTVGGSGLSSTATSLIAGSLSPTGYPASFPFKLRLSPRTSSEEVVKVTSGSGTTADPWIIVRGWDGTLAAGHDTTQAVEHGLTQEDLDLSREHEAADSTGTFVNEVLNPAVLPHGLPAAAWQGAALGLISSVFLTSARTTVNFTSIPQAYSHLMLVAFGKTGDPGVRDDSLQVTFNGDGGAVYSYVSNFVADATPGGGGSAADSLNAMPPLVFATNATGAPVDGGGVVFFPGYSGTTYAKMAIGISGVGQGTGSGQYSLRVRYCTYRPASQVAITSMSLTPQVSNFLAGSQFSLYGIS